MSGTVEAAQNPARPRLFLPKSTVKRDLETRRLIASTGGLRRLGTGPQPRGLSELASRFYAELRARLPSVLADLVSPDSAPPAPETILRLLLVQRWFGLPDDELLAEVADRLSLRSFCGLAWGEKPPSGPRLAAFRERLEKEPRARAMLREAADEGRESLLGPVPLISVVSPVYRAEGTVAELVRRLRIALSELTERFEIILVDDGSPDRSWERLEECCRDDSRILCVKLSRNFGQHAAITAGLAQTSGDWVVVMDCDLQDNPRYIPALYRKALEGFDVVHTVKERREHGPVKNTLAALFARVYNWLSPEHTTDPRVGAYSLISRRVVEEFLGLQDQHRHYLMLLRWLGFPSTHVTIQHEARFAGRSSYSFPALVRHAVNGIISHSDRLLYLSVGVGFFFLLGALLGILYLVIGYFHTGFQAGWTSTVVLILLSTSMILLSVGTSGIYIGKIFGQVKQRPLYVVDRVVGVPANHQPGS